MKAFILGFYLSVVTVLAIPTVMVYLEDKEIVTDLAASGSDEQWEFLKDISKLISYADDMGYKLTAGEMYRTMYQQRYNVAHGLSWTYNSYHLKKRAFDVNLFIDGAYTGSCEDHKVLGEYWESLNPKNRFGGRFNDGNHYERMSKEMSDEYRERPLCK